MTEISTLIDPWGLERARRADDARLAEALGKSALSPEIRTFRQLQQESALSRAREGLLMVASHIGAMSLKETAEMVGVKLTDESSESIN